MRSTLLILSSLLAISLAVPTLPGNLFFYTKLESVLANDETGRQPNATALGTPSSVPGYNGNGVRFNNGAVSDALLFGALAIDGPVTYTAWFKLDSLDAANGKIFSNKADYQTDPLGGEIEVDTANNAIKYVHGDKIVDGAPLAFALNTWYHVAFVGSAAAPTVVYINGSAVTNTIATGGNGPAVANPTKFFSIGSSTTADNTAINAGGAFKGIVDEVRVYNTTLTAAQVASVFNETFEVPTSTSTSTSATSSATSTSETSSTSTGTASTTNTIPTTLPSGLTAIPTTLSAGSTSVLSFFVLASAFLLIC